MKPPCVKKEKRNDKSFCKKRKTRMLGSIVPHVCVNRPMQEDIFSSQTYPWDESFQNLVSSHIWGEGRGDRHTPQTHLMRRALYLHAQLKRERVLQ